MTQNTLPETIGVDYFRHNLEKIFDEIINNGKTYILNKKGKGSVTLLATKTKTSIKTKNELLKPLINIKINDEPIISLKLIENFMMNIWKITQKEN